MKKKHFMIFNEVNSLYGIFQSVLLFSLDICYIALLLCVEILPVIDCSLSVIALISNTFADCADFKRMGYFKQDIHLLICFENTENIRVL